MIQQDMPVVKKNNTTYSVNVIFFLKTCSYASLDRVIKNIKFVNYKRSLKLEGNDVND